MLKGKGFHSFILGSIYLYYHQVFGKYKLILRSSWFEVFFFFLSNPWNQGAPISYSNFSGKRQNHLAFKSNSQDLFIVTFRFIWWLRCGQKSESAVDKRLQASPFLEATYKRIICVHYFGSLTILHPLWICYMICDSYYHFIHVFSGSCRSILRLFSPTPGSLSVQYQISMIFNKCLCFCHEAFPY